MKKNGIIKSLQNLDKRVKKRKKSAFVFFEWVCVCATVYLCIEICLHSFLLFCRCFWFSQHFIPSPDGTTVWSVNTSDFFFHKAHIRLMLALQNNWSIGWFAKGSHRFIDLIYCLCRYGVYSFDICLSLSLSFSLYSSVKKVCVRMCDLSTLARW